MPRRRSEARGQGDAYLMDKGVVPVDELIGHIMQFVTAGQRAGKLRRRGNRPDYESRRGDDWMVGSRGYAQDVMHMAVMKGAWIRDGHLIQHRDWQGEAASVASPSGEFVVPTMDEVQHHASLSGYSTEQWEVVIACYVVEYEKHDNQHEVAKDSNLSASDFAALGIHGFKSKDTVRRHLHAYLEWSGGVRPEPGQPAPIRPMKRAAENQNDIEKEQCDMTPEEREQQTFEKAMRYLHKTPVAVQIKVRDELTVELADAPDELAHRRAAG